MLHPRTHILTLSLFVLNGLIYVISALPHLTTTSLLFLSVVDLNPEAIVEGHQYWRLLTANLTHVDLTHLGANMMGLLIFGFLLEQTIGQRFFALWVLAAIIGADCTSLYFQVPHSVGFSGVVYGLEAGFIIVHTKYNLMTQQQPLSLTLRTLLGYVLLIILANSIHIEHVNIYAHFGGAVAGGLCALVYPISTRQTSSISSTVVVVLLMATCLLGLLLS